MKIRVSVEFEDGSETFENFTKVLGAQNWLEDIELREDLEPEPYQKKKVVDEDTRSYVVC